MPKGDNGGRHSLLTPEVRAIIVEAVATGLPYEMAGWAARICEKTMYTWLKRGQKDIDDNIESEWSLFLQDIKQAEMGRVGKHFNRINKGKKSWQANAWVLERRWRKNFGQDAAIIQELTSRLDSLEDKIRNKNEDPTL